MGMGKEIAYCTDGEVGFAHERTHDLGVLNIGKAKYGQGNWAHEGCIKV